MMKTEKPEDAGRKPDDEGMQLPVDRFQAAVWWCATVKKTMMYIAEGIQPPTSSNGGNVYDFSG